MSATAAERANDKCVILSSDEREMMIWALKYFAAESKEEQDQLNRSLPRSFDKDMIMNAVERLERMR
jgi:hypothetical protein